MKTLSSGVTRGLARVDSRAAHRLIDADRQQDPQRFWVGSRCTVVAANGQELLKSTVESFDRDSGTLRLQHPIPDPPRDVHYRLQTEWPAPVLAIRWILRLAPETCCPAVHIRLGTTRGTNALLTRTGAPTLLITTRGFADVPRIGNQTRPDLFALTIRKPEPLFSRVVEVDERIAADGRVLRPLCRDSVRELLSDGTDQQLSLAICLMNAWCNDTHERLIESVARECGFRHISRSSEVSPLIRFVPRCETTCLDAYLNPILDTYLQQIQDQLPGSRIQVMTSTGGLVERSRFRGRDCLLSGPAGGIVGFATAARREGFDRAIGFDMGGTSTDVSRFDGVWEYQNESIKGGVRVMTPVLAIETVAAGGGSICGFDGVRLFVGPQSAGADPGPACYGAGGPLTVTDLNVLLGRIPEHVFPFPLDVAAVRRRLEDLDGQLQQAGVPRPHRDLPQLAEGLLKIANDNMVQAIRRVSVARGFDPADDVLVTFGGAGGQHACSVARALRMRSVLIHPLAGVLSAWGIGHADTKAIRQCSHLSPLNSDALADVEQRLAQLELTAVDELTQQGVRHQDLLPVQRTLLLRYAGTDATIDVPVNSSEGLRKEFELRHRRLYGYIRGDRMLEIAGLRVEAVGQAPFLADEDTAREDHAPDRPGQVDQPRDSERRAAPADTVTRSRVWFNGRRSAATVYPGTAVAPGDEIPGPAIICEPTSTIVVEPGCVARVQPSGAILIRINDAPQTRRRSAGECDPVQLELMSNQFTSIAEQMGLTLRRTALSTNVRERLDYSCAVFDAEGRLVVNAPHVPVHLGAMQETVRAIMAEHADLQPGDVFVTNDPYRGGSHLPDLTVVTPVFVPSQNRAAADDSDAAPRPDFFVANRAHHAEIGGVVPGSMPPFSISLGEEGVLIRSCRLVERGESQEERIRHVLTAGPWPARTPDENLADLAAQAAANECGAEQLRELSRKHTVAFVTRAMHQIQQTSAEKMRQALERLPDGEHHFRDSLDDGTPVAVCVRIHGDQAHVDFSGTGGVHPRNLNANRAITTAAVLYTFRCLLRDDVPLNAGVLEPLTLVIPEGLLNPPPGDSADSSPAIAGGNVETSQRIVDVLLGALQLAAASQGTMNNLSIGDATFGYYETICGGAGATPDGDGADAVHTHMTNTRLTDPEVLERRYPVRLREFSIRSDSGGSGMHRGGHGVIRELEFLRPVTVSMLSQRRATQPWGMEGGRPGASGRNLLVTAAGDTECLDAAFSRSLQAGDVLRIETPGGGGWGHPDTASPDDATSGAAT